MSGATKQVEASSQAPRAIRGSVGLKIQMAVTGLIFIFYVLFHMYGNLKAFAGQLTFDEHGIALREFLVPIFPVGTMVWVIRVALILALFLHVHAALSLWGRSSQAGGGRYAVRRRTYAVYAKAMRWGGIALFLFLIFHLLHFTIMKFNVNGAFDENRLMAPDPRNPAVQAHSEFLLVGASFQVWWVLLVYLVALLALALHLRHGLWSACQTMGWTATPKSAKLAKLAGVLLAVVVAGGFALPPIAFAAGWIDLVPSVVP